MKNGILKIGWAGESLALLPERALWWKRERTLVITDPHFGKASAFRVAGIPAPELADSDDLGRLHMIVGRHAARRLVILGDFFHAKTGRSKVTLSALAKWRQCNADLEIVLVLGNHDRHAGIPPKDWRIRCVRGPWELAPFLCNHAPEAVKGRFVLAGHWHPSFRFNDRIGSGIHSPCFYFRAGLAVLPAYGSFTGMHPVKPRGEDRICLIGPDEVMDVFASRRRRQG
jgi:DNA ligase-associated metallophosphoesterase